VGGGVGVWGLGWGGGGVGGVGGLVDEPRFLRGHFDRYRVDLLQVNGREVVVRQVLCVRIFVNDRVMTALTRSWNSALSTGHALHLGSSREGGGGGGGGGACTERPCCS